VHIIYVGGLADAKQTTDTTVRKLLPPFKLLGFDIAGLSILFPDHSYCSYAGRYSPKWPFHWHICLWVIL